MRALVTGASGFIGSFLVTELSAKGYSVRALLLPQESATKLQAQGVEVVRGDITAPQTLTNVARDVDVVFHLAGRVLDWGAARLFREVMVEGTRHLLEACRPHGIKRFVYFSSFAALGFNRDLVGLDEDAERVHTGIPYCDTKIEAEDLVTEFCQTHRVAYTIIRPANVIGPGSVWVKEVLDAYYRGPMILIAGGKKPGAFVDVHNLIDGVLLAAESEKAINQTYHFRDETHLTWREYITEIGSWIGKKPSFNLSFELAQKAGAAAEILYAYTSSRPPLTRLAAGILGCDNDVDVSRARSELGWVSRVSADEAMREIKTWIETECRPDAAFTNAYFQNRMVYITGGSSGIGLETARQLATRGAHLVLLARNLDKLTKACEEVKAVRRSSHQRVAAISVDVADIDDVQNKLDQATIDFGPPDILINNAGVLRSNYFEKISFEDFDRVVKTNLYGVRNVTAALLPEMKPRGGQIAIVASAAGLTGLYSYTAYCASKFAVVGLAECLRSELKPHGIPVTLVCPPEVDTPMLADEAETLPPEARAVKKLAGALSVQVAAQAILTAIQKRRFLTIPGKAYSFLYLLHCLSLGTTSRHVSDWVIRRTLRQLNRESE